MIKEAARVRARSNKILQASAGLGAGLLSRQLFARSSCAGSEPAAQAHDHLGQIADWYPNLCQEDDAVVDGIPGSDQFILPVVWPPMRLAGRDTAREAAPVIQFCGIRKAGEQDAERSGGDRHDLDQQPIAMPGKE